MLDNTPPTLNRDIKLSTINFYWEQERWLPIIETFINCNMISIRDVNRLLSQTSWVNAYNQIISDVLDKYLDVPSRYAMIETLNEVIFWNDFFSLEEILKEFAIHKHNNTTEYVSEAVSEAVKKIRKHLYVAFK